MKRLNCLILIFLFTVPGFAQNDLQLRLTADQSAVGFLKKVYVSAVLKNVSGKEIKIAHPGFAEPLWNVDKHDWKISFNGANVKPYVFVERPYKKFAKKNNLVLKPGDSVIAGSYGIEFKEQGTYSIALTYSQQKDMAEAVYVDKDDVKENQDFTLTTAPLEFTIKIKTIAVQSPALPYEALVNKSIAYSFAEAFTDPEKTFRLVMKGITAADLPLLQHLKNLQWLELTDANLDTVPAFFSDLKLQYLSYTSAKRNIYFPPSLEKMTTLKTLYLGSMKLDTIPAFVNRLKELEKLEVRVAQLDRLSPEISCLSKLKELIIFWSNFEQVPDALKTMNGLEKLTLESGQLKNIDFLEYMPNLKFVKIAGSTSFRLHPLVQKLKNKGVEAYFF